MSHPSPSAEREPLIHLTKRSGIHPAKAWGIRFAALALGLVVCGLIAFLLSEKLRSDPKLIEKFYTAFFRASFGRGKIASDPYRKTWDFLQYSALLLCIALALTPAFRMRFWNIGAEGQTLIGMLGASAVNFYLGGKVPEWLLLILMLLAALAAGAVWGLIPALFKARWGTNETLFTLMMNYVAMFLTAYLIKKWQPMGSGTLAFAHGKLPALINNYLLIILMSVALAAAMFVYLRYSKHGYEINVVGESERTAKYVGINVKKVIIRTMLLSGMLCGLTGFLFAGLDQNITRDSIGGRGFTAIIVAWLAKFNPLVMILMAALVLLLQRGAGQLSQDLNVQKTAMPDVIVGVILFFIIGCEFFINYQVHFRGHGHHREEAVK
ncbi:MAG: ABC transporter permease [Clostridiales bacterium]|nr:ABC transporter permease [Clostridiales bacterium]